MVEYLLLSIVTRVLLASKLVQWKQCPVTESWEDQVCGLDGHVERPPVGPKESKNDHCLLLYSGTHPSNCQAWSLEGRWKQLLGKIEELAPSKCDLWRLNGRCSVETPKQKPPKFPINLFLVHKRENLELTKVGESWAVVSERELAVPTRKGMVWNEE